MAKASQDTIELDIEATTSEDIKVPVGIVVTFPRGYGFTAAKVLQKLPEQMDAIFRDLVHRQDAQTIQQLLAAQDEDDEEGDGQ